MDVSPDSATVFAAMSLPRPESGFYRRRTNKIKRKMHAKISPIGIKHSALLTIYDIPLTRFVILRRYNANSGNIVKYADSNWRKLKWRKKSINYLGNVHNIRKYFFSFLYRQCKWH